MPEQTDIYISSFPDAESITNADKVTGLQGNANKNFTFSSILAWFVNAVKSAFVPVSRTINGKTLNTNITLNASDVGAQGEITASGLLKGDGAGGVSAATPGTDYGTYSKPSGGIPASDLASGVVPAASDATPQALGTASAGISNDYSRADHVHQIPEIPSNVEANPAGAATDTLTKLQVDQTIYAIDGIDYLTVVNGQICVVYEVTP